MFVCGVKLVTSHCRLFWFHFKNLIGKKSDIKDWLMGVVVTGLQNTLILWLSKKKENTSIELKIWLAIENRKSVLLVISTTLKYVSIFMYLCVYVHVCINVYVSACVCACVWESQKTALAIHPSGLIHHIFGCRVNSWSRAHRIR